MNDFLNLVSRSFENNRRAQGSNQNRSSVQMSEPELKKLVRCKVVHIGTGFGGRALEDKFGYTKEGHGRHYLIVGSGKFGNPGSRPIDKAWDRRCDASRWAKRAGVKEIRHWYQC